jgi:hypothetical protein
MGVDYHVGTGPGMGGLAFRMTDPNNFLLLLTYVNTLQFYQHLASGAWVLLGSQPLPAPLVPGSTHRLDVHTSGTVLQGWWDGLQLLQITDTSGLTGTRHGLDWNSAYDPTTTYGNFQLSTR